ncbi:hypothetical protein RHGRI_029502 [Rhododendron griersonianum]|uniref:Uncharacterized protein n=1 Tax=Rhododendron griersonianum TaxID=479676 RepID=A0AAV6INB0_9ERIC|nr:hypothetical protein RHGRI_029502 [Rhododendron griersonianum]
MRGGPTLTPTPTPTPTDKGSPTQTQKGCRTDEGCPTQTYKGSRTNKGTRTEKDCPTETDKGFKSEKGGPSQTGKGSRSDKGGQSQTDKGSKSDKGGPNQTGKGSRSDKGGQSQTDKGSKSDKGGPSQTDSDYEQSDDDGLYEANVDEEAEWAGFDNSKGKQPDLNEDLDDDDDDGKDYGDDSSDDLHSACSNSDDDRKKDKFHEYRRETDLGKVQFTVGMKFPSAKEFREAVKTHKSEHDCLRSFKVRHVTSMYLAEKYVDSIRSNPDMPLDHLQQRVRKDLVVDISHTQAYRAKRKELDLIEGTNLEQFAKLRDYCEKIRRTNPNTTIIMKTIPSPTPDGQPIFERLYITATLAMERRQMPTSTRVSFTPSMVGPCGLQVDVSQFSLPTMAGVANVVNGTIIRSCKNEVNPDIRRRPSGGLVFSRPTGKPRGRPKQGGSQASSSRGRGLVAAPTEGGQALRGRGGAGRGRGGGGSGRGRGRTDGGRGMGDAGRGRGDGGRGFWKYFTTTTCSNFTSTSSILS